MSVSHKTTIKYTGGNHTTYIQITSSTCFVVLGTYDPTTMRPPFLSLFIPRSLGGIGALGIIPILAETKLAAVRHKKRLPFSSAYHTKQKLIKWSAQNLMKIYQKFHTITWYKYSREFALIIPAAKTAMSLSLAALTMHVDPCFMSQIKNQRI